MDRILMLDEGFTGYWFKRMLFDKFGRPFNLFTRRSLCYAFFQYFPFALLVIVDVTGTRHFS